MLVEREPPEYRSPGYNPEFLKRIRKRREAEEAERRREEAQRNEEARQAKLAEIAEQSAKARRAGVAKAKAELRALLSVSPVPRVMPELDGTAPVIHTLRGLERRTCRIFGVTSKELRNDRKGRYIVFARQFFTYWAARLTNHSYPALGRYLGGRDHTTSIHSVRAYVEKRAKQGRTLRRAR